MSLPTSNSGGPGDSNELITFYIPVLALALVGVPLCYFVLALNASGASRPFFELGFAAVVAVLAMQGTLSGERGFVRGVAIVCNIVLPLGMVLLSLRPFNSELFGHGVMTLLFAAIAWLPVAVVTDMVGPILRVRQEGAAAPPVKISFPPPSVIVIGIIGGILFMMHEAFLRGGESLPTPIPFAIIFFLVALALISLSKLLQKAHETPYQPITIAEDFAHQWIGLMLVALVIAGLLAFLLPKQALRRWVERREAQQQQQASNRRSPLPGLRPETGEGKRTETRHRPGTGPGSDRQPQSRDLARQRPGQQPSPQQRPAPNGKSTNPDKGNGQSPTGTGNGKSPAGKGQGNAGDAQPGAGTDARGTGGKGGRGAGQPDQQPGAKAPAPTTEPGNEKSNTAKPGNDPFAALKRALDRMLLRLEDAALEGLKQTMVFGEEHPPVVKSPNTPPTAESVRRKADEARQLIRQNPWRLLKVLPVALLLGLGIAVLVMAFWRHRGHPGRALSAIGHAVRQLLGYIVAPWRKKQHQRTYDEEIARLMAEDDPFADPFTHDPPLPPEELAQAAYRTFLACLWLQGHTRKENQTEWDFAEWLCEHARLPRAPIRTITDAYVRGHYAARPLGAAELAALQQALQQIITHVTGPIPEDELTEKQTTYRRQLAEDKYRSFEKVKA